MVWDESTILLQGLKHSGCLFYQVNHRSVQITCKAMGIYNTDLVLYYPSHLSVFIHLYIL